MKTVRVPHVFVLVFGLAMGVALIGQLVPPGAFDRDANGRVVAGTFHYLSAIEAAKRPQGLSLFFEALKSPLTGLKASAAIVAFILVIGGAFKVIEHTGAFEAAIHRTIGALRGKERWIIPVSMVVFSGGGAVFGMSEEVIPFVLLLLPLMRALGYAPIIAVAVPLIGAGMGFAGAMINPFTVGIAQAIAGLPPLSGWEFRTGLWTILTVVGIGFVFIKAQKYKVEVAATEASEAPPELTRAHVGVLGALAAGIGIVLWGIHAYTWYVVEIGAVFLGVGLVSGIIARRSANQMADDFQEGAKELLSAALAVALARGVVVVAEHLFVLDTVLYATAEFLQPLSGTVALGAMFVFQSVLNFLVPSGSGQAALTMPIMAPLAELCGLTRQMAVLAFQLGDGFTNLITPTSAVLMGALEVAKVRYEDWFRFAIGLQAILLGVGFVALGLAVFTGFGP